MDHSPLMPGIDRRAWLQQTALGFGSIGLAGLLADSLAADALAPRVVHAPPRAQRVIFLFMQGGQSQMDLFDGKPELARRDGEPVNREKPDGPLLKGSPFAFTPHGESGLELSELLPQLARHADRLCLIKSVHTDSANHSNAMLMFHTGSQSLVRPSIGSWIVYGLGTTSQSLPGFITIRPTRGHGSRVYSNAFLPAVYQGTPIGSDGTPAAAMRLDNLSNPRWSPAQQRAQLALTQSLNARLNTRTAASPEMDGLIQSFERAFRMQATAPAIFDLEREPQAVRALYGIDQKETDAMGRMCLLARRLSEAGVRCVQVNMGGWDHHGSIDRGIAGACRRMDRPAAALLTDLEQRGLLDDTLVISSGEFGRTPTAEGEFAKAGRNHNSHAFYGLDGGRRGTRWVCPRSRPTRSGRVRSKIRFTSTTCMRPCCICWASTTSDSPTPMAAVIFGSPTFTAASSTKILA